MKPYERIAIAAIVCITIIVAALIVSHRDPRDCPAGTVWSVFAQQCVGA